MSYTDLPSEIKTLRDSFARLKEEQAGMNTEIALMKQELEEQTPVIDDTHDKVVALYAQIALLKFIVPLTGAVLVGLWFLYQHLR